jgi:LmbE family N-acetylglucosaminyl deacetylase
VLGFPLASADQPIRRILAIGAHADDLEIGCGATLLAATRTLPDVEVTWVVLGAQADRELEARASAEAFLASASDSNVVVHGFRDGYLPYLGGEVKDTFEELKRTVDPDLIFTHYRDDLHQDHRLTCELTWNTWRNNVILEYEIPKYDGDLGVPNVFVPLDDGVVEEKLQLLREHYVTQRGKHWFDDELFRGLMRLRGMEAATRYAEAFTCRKLTLLTT